MEIDVKYFSTRISVPEAIAHGTCQVSPRRMKMVVSFRSAANHLGLIIVILERSEESQGGAE